MNRKLIIAAIAIIAVAGIGLFALTNTSTNSSSSISIDASALEDMSNLAVDGEKLEKNNVFIHSESSDVNALLVKNGGAFKIANGQINKT